MLAGVRFAFALLVALAPLSAACINTDAAVFVDPTLDAAGGTLSSSAFGVSVTGVFHLKLHLGARASGSSQVSLGSFAILDADRKAAIVESLVVDASPTNFPVTVEQDSDVDVSFTFNSGKA